jgi:hypothetical protein
MATAVIMWVCWNHMTGGGRAVQCVEIDLSVWADGLEELFAQVHPVFRTA